MLNQIILEGYNYMEGSCSFGSGINDDINKSNLNLNNYFELIDSYECFWKKRIYEKENEEILNDIKGEMKDLNIEINKNNLEDFLGGCLNFIKEELLEEYRRCFEDNKE